MLTTEQMQLVCEWQEVANQSKEFSKREMELRKQVAALLVPENTVGIHRFPLGNQPYKVKVVLGETVQLDKDAGLKLGNVYQSLIQAGLEPQEASDLIKIKQELSIGAYNKLSANMQKIMSEVVTSKRSAPTIEIETIKEGK